MLVYLILSITPSRCSLDIQVQEVPSEIWEGRGLLPGTLGLARTLWPVK